MITLLLLIPLIGSILILLTPKSLTIKNISSDIILHDQMSIFVIIKKIFFNINNIKSFLRLNNVYKTSNISSISELWINLETLSIEKQIALITSLITFFISLFIWYNFDSNLNEFQFVSEYSNWSIYQLNFGVDGVSLYFILLTTFISPIALLSNYNNITHSQGLKWFLVSILVLETLQICAFVSLDLLLYYVFFESVLPVLFVLIVLFGHGNDRYRSAFLFFLYTLTGSLPMLLSILVIYSYIGSTDFQIISLFDISLDYQKILWIGFFIAFAFKTPLYPFVIWLPKAHADSVLAGSIILAATILKLAVYGEIRILVNYLPDATFYFLPLIQTIAIVSLIFASFSTLVQMDTKRIVAYSSIAHMAVMTLGVFSNTIQGIEGAILLAIAHAFTSPGLFICVGGVIFDRTGSRNIFNIRGLVHLMPIFTLIFFMFILTNTGIPLSLNWLGEIMSLMGIWFINPVVAVLASTGIILSACYSLYLYNRLSYGSYSPYLKILKDLNRREYYLLLSLLIPVFVLGILPNVILNTIHLSSSYLIYFRLS